MQAIKGRTKVSAIVCLERSRYCIEALNAAGIDVQFHRHQRARQRQGIGDIFLKIEIERAFSQTAAASEARDIVFILLFSKGGFLQPGNWREQIVEHGAAISH